MKNEWILEGDILKVYAYKKEVRLEFIFDSDELTLLQNISNKLRVDQDGYLVYQFAKKKRNYTKRIHRLIMGEPEGKVIDHINGNKQDNRKCNLRVATHQENQRNRNHRSKPPLSGYRNVYYMKTRDRYQVRLKIDGKMKNFGYFKDLEEAKRVADEARKQYFGEFAGKAA